MTEEEERIWTFFRNEQKLNKNLRKEVAELRKRLQIIGSLEKSVRNMELENTRLRSEVKRLRAVNAALGEGND
jgi:cell shape-determining protein MreC